MSIRIGDQVRYVKGRKVWTVVSLHGETALLEERFHPGRTPRRHAALIERLEQA